MPLSAEKERKKGRSSVVVEQQEEKPQQQDPPSVGKHFVKYTTKKENSIIFTLLFGGAGVHPFPPKNYKDPRVLVGWRSWLVVGLVRLRLRIHGVPAWLGCGRQNLKFLVPFHIVKARMPFSGEETGRQHYIAVIGMHLYDGTLKSVTNSWSNGPLKKPRGPQVESRCSRCSNGTLHLAVWKSPPSLGFLRHHLKRREKSEKHFNSKGHKRTRGKNEIRWGNYQQRRLRKKNSARWLNDVITAQEDM
ncbi:hypothetical protein TNCV_3848681 [Trichonephila clavipes]|uniref:Uncharacterized protein n=1 Tax=Trichonephila clavipes TaxID=2585209 RepID=A0A8X6R8C3_TRICX|nr:hypothetical protein TNCV_3848681 [Trichonephila clavipes]